MLMWTFAANEDLNMTTTPLLSLIFDKLDGLASSSSEIVPPLAREARLVLSLRRASFFASTPSSTTDPLAASRERYQEALRLLQDPILPVRAQGLTILRSLVANREALLSTDPALLPAVLDIFVQAVEDEDSFLYLNAIQGLSSMVDVYGRQIVKRLVEVYLGGRAGRVEEVGTGDKGRRELDKRLRIGETLVQVIQRAGEAFTVLGLSLFSPSRAQADVLATSERPHPLPPPHPPHFLPPDPSPLLSSHHPYHRDRNCPHRSPTLPRPPHRSLHDSPLSRIPPSPTPSSGGRRSAHRVGQRFRYGDGGGGGGRAAIRSRWEAQATGRDSYAYVGGSETSLPSPRGDPLPRNALPHVGQPSR